MSPALHPPENPPTLIPRNQFSEGEGTRWFSSYPPIERYQALRDNAPCLSRAATLPNGTEWGSEEAVHLGNTILNQTYRCRISTDRLNREDSQLAAFLEGEPGPTIAGKTLFNTHTPKRGFGGREGTRYYYKIITRL